jgi:hypothetical protein
MKSQRAAGVARALGSPVAHGPAVVYWPGGTPVREGFMTISKIMLGSAVVAGLGLCQAAAQEWPARPVRIVAPFAAGGSADTLGRI